MMTDKSETLDAVCKEAYKEKSVAPYTWAELADRTIWTYAFCALGYYVVSILAVYSYVFGLYSVPVKWWTIIWAFIVGYVTFFGTTAGAHRMWSHRAYKAKLPLKILLMIFFTTMGMYPLFYWIKDHRAHHKYSETDADPHNPERGFIFSHIGWVVMKRHPDCIRRGREIDMSDIIEDPVVMFQKKYATGLKLLLCFVIPTLVPIIFWRETILHAILTQCFIRYVICTNILLAINSVAHRWGNRPYNRFINPADNSIISLISMGEGSHNYHHTFPWDYKSSELPYMNFNSTTLFIKAMAKIGWAYDLCEPSPELVEAVINRIGYKSEVAKVY